MKFKRIYKSEVDLRSISLFFTLLLLFSCQAKLKEGSTPKEQKLIDRGRVVYISTCVACHNADPRFDGATGPSLKNSSLELVRLRVLYTKYPDSYTPKRTTSDMPEFDDLKDDITALHAFLNK